jgi:hypothetical protein
MINSLIDRSREIGFRLAVRFGVPESGPMLLILPCVVGLMIGILIIISPLLALGVVLIFTLTVAAWLKPILLCYITVIAVALTSGVERGILIPLFRPNELVVVFSAGLGLLIILTREANRRINFHQIGAAIIVLIVGTTILPGAVYLLRGTQLTIEDGYTLLGPIKYILVFLIFAYLPNNIAERKRIVKLMVWCAAIVAIVGLLQAANVGFVIDFLNRWYSSTHLTEAPVAGRVTSLISAWNSLGIFMMINLLIIWAIGISSPSEMSGWVIIVAGFLFTACLILSGSYAGVVGLILGVCLIAIFLRGLNRRTIILLLGLGFMFLIAVTLYGAFVRGRLHDQFGYGGTVPETLVARIRIWQDIYIPPIQQNLMWGVNPTVPSTYSWQYTESQFISELFSFGLVGLIGFLAWIVITLSWLKKKFRLHHGFLRQIVAVAAAVMIVLFIAGVTNPVFTYSGVVDYLWIMLALATADEYPKLQGADQNFTSVPGGSS